jgi:hypothetical protein
MGYKLLSYADNQAPSLADAEKALKEDPAITHVSMVHSETTSGIINDITVFGEVRCSGGGGCDDDDQRLRAPRSLAADCSALLRERSWPSDTASRSSLTP